MARKHKGEKKEELPIKDDVAITGLFFKYKKYLPIVILLFILLLAFKLRSYHLEYPVVGYHNWKETHYQTEARNFARDGFFKYGFFIPAWDYPILDFDENSTWTQQDGAHSDSFPTISIVVGTLFRIFGTSLKVARLTNIMFILLGIVMLYFFMKELFGREDIALTSAFIAATLPLLVFFGRQTQLVNPNFFFMITCLYFYIRWYNKRKNQDLIFMSVFLTLTLLTKYDFFYVGIPIALTFPYKSVLQDIKKLNLTQYIISGCIFLLFPAWFLYTKYISPKIHSTMFADAIEFSIIFTSEFWRTIKMFIIDNYTITGWVFAFLGIILLIIIYNKKNFGQRFLLLATAGAVPWIYFVSGYLKGHAYHQYPIVPIIIMLMAFFIVSVSVTVEKLLKVKYLRWLFIIILLLVYLYNPIFQGGNVFSSINRQFDTQFIGLDVAGDYIREHSQPDERLAFPSHQSYGVLWHADRKGYPKGWQSVDALIYGEEQRNLNWIFIYQWGMDIFQNPELWAYISEHYSLRQFAFQQSQNEIRPMYFLLQRGGSFNLSDLNSILEGKPMQYKDYEYTFGANRLFYVNVD